MHRIDVLDEDSAPLRLPLVRHLLRLARVAHDASPVSQGALPDGPSVLQPFPLRYLVICRVAIVYPHDEVRIFLG